MKSKHIDTFCVHPIARDAWSGGSVTSPLFTSTAYSFMDDDDLVYPGFFTTYNQVRLADIITLHERGEWGMVVNSGMAAISVVLLANLKTGDHIILSRELYGGTMKLVTTLLHDLGVTHSFAGPDIAAFQAQQRAETKLIFLETPSNPGLSIYPLMDIAALAQSRGIVTGVDNTMATSINQRPIESGIDISVQSGTKFLGGHNDMQFGTIVCKDRSLSGRILQAGKLVGASLSPEQCHAAERSLKTLALRVKRQNESATAVAAFLDKHPLVSKVYYPGLESHPGHDVAIRQMDGFGSLISFDLSASADRVIPFMKALRLVQPALSFGGLETVICQPSRTSHRDVPEARRKELGINDTMLRISIGIEHVDDIIMDLDQALHHAVNVKGRKMAATL